MSLTKEQIAQAISCKRREKAENDLSAFITLYLKGLTQFARPLFHNEILGLLNASICHTRAIVRQENKKSNNTEGGDAPIPLESDLIVSTLPHFPQENSKHDTDKLVSDKPLNALKQKEEYKDTKEGENEPLRGDEGAKNPHLSRILIQAPRGFAKSTLCSVAFPLWLALYKKKKDIFLVSATISLAREQLRKIRNEIEGNERILRDFGDMKSEKWTEDVLILSNGSIIRAKGRGFQIRGFRPDQIVCDDLEDEEVIYSKDQRDKLESWFFRTLLPALKPDQNLVYIGTKIHQFSLISKLQEKEEFESRIYRALTGDKSIWEDMWSTNTLKKLRKELGEYAFQAEYQNNPISLSEQPVKPHMLERVKIGGKAKIACLALDPAISEREGSDPRAIGLFEMTDEGFREVLSEQGRWGVEEQVDKVIDIYEKFHKNYDILRVVIEAVAFQKVLQTLVTKKARQRGLYIPVSEAELGTKTSKRPRDKFTRLLQVVHLFEQRIVEIKNPELYQQLLAFPIGDYDDLVDMCVFALYWLMNFRSGGFFMKKEEKKLKDMLPDVRSSYYVREIRPGVFATEKGIMPLPRLNKNVLIIGDDS